MLTRCLNPQIALSQIYKLVPQFLRDMHIELANPEKPWTSSNHWFNRQEGVIVKVSRRKKE